MARLIPNPIGDVTQPLGRIEKSIDKLGDQLHDVEALPRIEDHLMQVELGISSIVDALREIHTELRTLNETVAKRGDLA
jgi:hypothetical protein